MAMKTMNMGMPHSQRGVYTLVIAMVILVTVTFVTLYTSRTVLMEQKIATNEFRGRMAFEAAETGLESAVNSIAMEWPLDVSLDVDGNIVTNILTANIIFDIDHDGAPDSNVSDLANGSLVTVTLTGDVSDDLVRYNILAVGESDDRAARRTISQTLVMVPPVPNTPDSPLLSRSSISMGGSATIINPEGHSTIWSGGNVNIGTNNSTKTEIADPTSDNYPDCLGGSVQCTTTPSSSPEVLGLDIIGNDSSLDNLTDNEFFYNFLGEFPKNFKESRTDLVVAAADMDTVAGTTGEGKVIWVDGDAALTANWEFGTMTDPALVIIDGNFDVGGTVNFYGLLFVRGSITGGGNLNVTGSAVVTGVGTTGGGVTVTYNSQVLRLLNKLGGRPAGSTGSWRDFS